MNKQSNKVKHFAHNSITGISKLLRRSVFWMALFVGVISVSTKQYFLNSLWDNSPEIEMTSTQEVQVKKVSVDENEGTSLFNFPEKMTPFQVDTNIVNSFSNVGFILNPTYARKNKVDPSVVAAKRRICLDYVERYQEIAVTEMNKFGIPASVTLAQGLLESNAGASRLARQNKNHFGIKCFQRNCSKGHCTNYTDDSHKDFFRNYNSVWESYRAHSLFLQKKRYMHLLKLSKTDYKAWAKGLRKAGYATDPKYAEKLIKIIEELKLYQYDRV